MNSFGQLLKDLRQQARLTQSELAQRLGYAGGHAVISKIENGHRTPDADFAMAAGKVLGHTDDLVQRAATDRAALLRQRADILAEPSPGAVDAMGGPPAPWTVHAPSAEEDTTDRREILVGGGLTAAVTVQSLAQRISTSDPTELDRAQIGQRIQQVAEAYISAPRAQLRAAIEHEHLGVEALLDRRLSRSVRDELAGYAGMYAYYLGALAHGTGDDGAAVAYGTLCAHHAQETGDPMLLGAAAELRSGLVPTAACAQITGQARRDPAVDPYVRPFLAAIEARAAAQLQQPDRANEALAAMEAGVWTGPLQPGPTLFDPESGHAWFGIVLAELGQGEAAEGYARQSLRLLAGHDKPYHAAGTYNMLARSYLRRRTPDPEQAADATGRALRLVEGRPGRSAITSADTTWRELNVRWGTLPAVRDLGEQVAVHRAALPAPRPALI
ncbi:helix-turn-helix domain-containing protein [Frankia sp. AgPm24]|uniref:helix-turn-helix domain-containing protein n=1 Tax=Frankia sp. AgPm24 TaxID=631128 RepID=UPI00200E2D9F|nr:helix-turn-helix transcriptional regulator [Frankia sp. AgPm24]MCK9921231.1 helix-turn-helix domain-containing protein [Frankia sp. AgPm24]